MPWECPEGSELSHLSSLKSHGVREADKSIVGTRYDGTSTSSLGAHSEKEQMRIDSVLQGDVNPLVSMRHSEGQFYHLLFCTFTEI